MEEYDAVSNDDEGAEHEAISEHQNTEYEHEAAPDEATKHDDYPTHELDATAEIPDATHNTDTESHVIDASTVAASSALNEGDRSVIQLMHLDVEAIAALELLGAHDSNAKGKLVMKLLLKKALLNNPSAFVTRAVWNFMKRDE